MPHTVEVATILATFRLDGPSIIAGLIHEIVQDTALSLSDVDARFGKETLEVAGIPNRGGGPSQAPLVVRGICNLFRLAPATTAASILLFAISLSGEVVCL